MWHIVIINTAFLISTKKKWCCMLTPQQILQQSFAGEKQTNIWDSNPIFITELHASVSLHACMCVCMRACMHACACVCVYIQRLALHNNLLITACKSVLFCFQFKKKKSPTLFKKIRSDLTTLSIFRLHLLTKLLMWLQINASKNINK